MSCECLARARRATHEHARTLLPRQQGNVLRKLRDDGRVRCAGRLVQRARNRAVAKQLAQVDFASLSALRGRAIASHARAAAARAAAGRTLALPVTGSEYVSRMPIAALALTHGSTASAPVNASAKPWRAPWAQPCAV